MREGSTPEVLGLKWDAMDFENDTFTVRHTVVKMDKVLYKKDSTKNSSSYRMMPIPNVIKNRLIELKAQQTQYKLMQPNDYCDEGYIFTHEDGKLILPNYVSHQFKQIVTRSNLPIIRFHDLRHSSASYLLYLGFNLKDIQAWLGHDDIQTTMNIYAHIDLTAKKNIADSLNEKFKCFAQ